MDQSHRNEKNKASIERRDSKSNSKPTMRSIVHHNINQPQHPLHSTLFQSIVMQYRAALRMHRAYPCVRIRTRPCSSVGITADRVADSAAVLQSGKRLQSSHTHDRTHVQRQQSWHTLTILNRCHAFDQNQMHSYRYTPLKIVLDEIENIETKYQKSHTNHVNLHLCTQKNKIHLNAPHSLLIYIYSTKVKRIHQN